MVLVILCWIIVVASSTLWIYSRRIARHPRIHGNKEAKFYQIIQDDVKALREKFYPCWWCPWGIPQTLLRFLLRSLPKLGWKREIVSLSDGGQLGIDWLNPAKEDKDTPTLIMLPGMTSSTHDCAYILYSAQLANAKGYRVVVVNPRGLGGVPLITARTYNPAKTDDLKTVLQLVNSRYPTGRKLLAGFSLGGMSVWNYLSTETKDSVGVDAAMLISSPFDPIEASFVNEKPLPKNLFNRFLAKVLRDYIKPYRHLFEDKLDWDDAMNLQSVREYDHYVTAKIFGYRDWIDYYHHAALNHKHKIHSIPVPTLCVNAADDCFSPMSSLPLKQVQKTDNIVMITTKHGGHLSFMESTNPSGTGFDERVLSDYSDFVFSTKFETL